MSWAKRIANVVLVGVAWAAAWAPVAVIMGLIVDPDGSMDEMWPAIGAYPGFLCAIVFCVALGIAHRGRKLHQLPISGGAALGALSGLVVGVVPVLIAEPAGRQSQMAFGATVLGVLAVLSAVSGVLSVLVARRMVKRGMHRVGARAA